MTPDGIVISIAIVLAAVIVRAAVGSLKLSPSIQIAVPSAPEPVIKFMLPADIQRIAHEAHRAIVEQRQPDGTWSEIGHFDFGSEDDPATWPARAHAELAADGRRFTFPSGRIVEHPIESTAEPV